MIWTIPVLAEEEIGYPDPITTDILYHEEPDLPNLTLNEPVPLPPIPTLPIMEETIQDSIAAYGFPVTDYKTLGNVILEPITPTPIEYGYAYYNPLGTDPSYVIFAPGTYTLGTGFSTSNNSAILIGASNVTLDGNQQIINGTGSGNGIRVLSGASDAIIKDFAGIYNFHDGIYSQGYQTRISDNIANNTRYNIYSRSDGASIINNEVNGRNFAYGIISNGNNAILKGNYANYFPSPYEGAPGGIAFILSGDHYQFTENNVNESHTRGVSITGNNGIFSKNRVSISSISEIHGNNLIIEENFFNKDQILMHRVTILLLQKII